MHKHSFTNIRCNTTLMYKTDKKQLRRRNSISTKNIKFEIVTQGNSGMLITVIYCKLYIIFHFQKKRFLLCKITCDVQYSFSPYTVGELTVNHITGFYCSIFTVFTIKFTVIFLQCISCFGFKSVFNLGMISKFCGGCGLKSNYYNLNSSD